MRVLDVCRSGFYAWLERPPSPHALENERLKVAILAAHVKIRETYSAKRTAMQPGTDARARSTCQGRVLVAS